MKLVDWLKQETARGATHVAVVRTDSGEIAGNPIAITAPSIERLIQATVKKARGDVFVPLAVKSTSGSALPIDR